MLKLTRIKEDGTIMSTSKKIKIGLITSKGGHLFQLSQLKPWWRSYERFWVTFRGLDSRSILTNETVHYAHYPESRNLKNFLKNLILAYQILKRNKPDLLISCGAGIAPPFFYIAKIMSIKTIFIEPYDFIKYPSLSGKLVYPIADLFLVQHQIQQKHYPKSKYLGSII